MFVTMVTTRLGCNIFAREIARDAVTSYEVGKGLIANGWFKPVFTMAIKLKSGQI